MSKLDITERLERIAQGQHLDLADIVCRDAIDEIKAIRIAVEEMRAALEPFAAFAEAAEQFVDALAKDNGSQIMPTRQFRLADFRRASAAVVSSAALAAQRETGAHSPAGIADAPETPAEMVSEIVRLRSDLAKARASVEEQKTSAGNVIHKLHAERDQATRDVVSLEREVIRLKAALRSVATQCGNVIYNCEQRPADNERHLSSWRGVKDFAEGSCSVPSTSKTCGGDRHG